MANFAARRSTAGADGLVLFNRFYQPDLDLDTLEIGCPGALVAVGAAPAAALDRHPAPDAWHAGESRRDPGVHRGDDVAKALLVGADVAMTTSAVLRHGPEHVSTMEAELLAWMNEHEYTSVDQLRSR